MEIKMDKNLVESIVKIRNKIFTVAFFFFLYSSTN